MMYLKNFFMVFLVCILAQLARAGDSVKGKGCHESNNTCWTFDELDEQADALNIYDTIEVKPPHPIMVWIAWLGLPIFEKMILIQEHMGNAWTSFINFLAKERAHHEASQQ